MVLDKTIEKEIGGKTYKLCLPIKYVFKVERELVDGNMIIAMARLEHEPMRLEDCYTLIKYSLMGGCADEEKAEEMQEKAEEIFLQAVNELSFTGVITLALEVLQKSGVFGKQKKE